MNAPEPPPLAVGGNRLGWTDLPPRLRAQVEAVAGAAVRAETSQPGGFSPGLASLLHLADGRDVFLKAVNADRNPDSPGLHRREAQVLAALPADVPAPRLKWTYDDGDWVALLIEAVPGRLPTQPWLEEELAVFVDTAERLTCLLDPAPLTAPRLVERYAEAFTGWRKLAGQPGGGDALDPWAQARLGWLAEFEQTWPLAADGQALLHMDLRSDNVLLTGSSAVVVDWPHVCQGAAWVDLLAALPSIAMHGGGDPQQLWQRYRPARDVDPAAVTAVLAAVTGFFLHLSRQPPPLNLPRVRAFQRAQGEAALAWLRRRCEAGMAG